MLLLKQSTTVTIKMGPFLDKTDGVTEETGLTPAVEVSKNGGAFAARNSATAVSHDAEGWYGVELDATDTGTLGRLQVKAQASATHLPVWHEFMVVTANFYDSVSGSDTLQADLTQMGGVAQSATDLKDFADAGYDPAANKVQGVVLVDTTTTNTDMRGTDNAALASVLGALTDAAAAGDPTTADTIMQYVKQIVNVLVGTTGVTTFPAEAAPANNVSLAEVIRAIHADVTGLNGDAMRGTDSAALASVCTEARLSELDAATAGKMANQVDIIEADTTALNDTKIPDTLSLANINAEVVDVHNTDTITLPGQAAPPASPTLRQAVGWLYKIARNRKRQTATTWELMDDAETTVDAKATVSDDGTTAIKQEIVSGP